MLLVINKYFFLRVTPFPNTFPTFLFFLYEEILTYKTMKKKAYKQIYALKTSKKKVVYSHVCFLCFLKASKRKKKPLIFLALF